MKGTTKTFYCPSCLQATFGEDKVPLEERRPRVFTCPSCRTEFSFNELHTPYDLLQQFCFKEMARLGDEMRTLSKETPPEIELDEEGNPATKQGRTMMQTYELHQKQLANKSSDLSVYANLQGLVSKLLTASYELYEEEKMEDVPE